MTELRPNQQDGGTPEASIGVLVAEGHPREDAALASALRVRGIRPEMATNAEDALALVRAGGVDLVIARQGLPGRDGVDLLAELRQHSPAVRRVLLSDTCDPAVTREAVNRAGVAYLLPASWTDAALDDVCRGLSRRGRSNASPASTMRFPGIVGSSPALRELLHLVERVARTESTVLITGETGTGKELISRAVHEASSRRDNAFCAVNSAAFPETLLESELFGHLRGAFTGASSNSKGLFERAHKGTVFLDEVGEMPLSMQAKLLRFLQTGEIRPIGADRVHYVDVRLVTATNKNLETAVSEGLFREDLFYRLAVIPMHVPPLRERKEDIPLLARHFLARMVERSGTRVKEIDGDALEVLTAHCWPGNIRELENVIERCVALCPGECIGVGDLPRRLREGPPRSAPAQEVESLPGLERKHILETLDRVGWNRRRAAEVLQISTTTLWRRLRQFGIDADGRTHRGAPLGG